MNINNTITFDFTNVPQDDIDELVTKLNDNIKWIASGARDRYKQRRELEDKLLPWARALSAQIRDEYNISCSHTSYYDWEYKIFKRNITVFIPYTTQGLDSFKSFEDFKAKVYVGTWNKTLLGSFHTFEEIKAAVALHNVEAIEAD